MDRSMRANMRAPTGRRTTMGNRLASDSHGRTTIQLGNIRHIDWQADKHENTYRQTANHGPADGRMGGRTTMSKLHCFFYCPPPRLEAWVTWTKQPGHPNWFGCLDVLGVQTSTPDNDQL